jgi:hypothetical protein
MLREKLESRSKSGWVDIKFEVVRKDQMGEVASTSDFGG